MRFGIVLILLFILASCAQVGALAGGETDVFAPKPDSLRMSPRNGSTSFTGKQIVVHFDEFIKLNNPSETIIVVPPTIQPKAKVKNKTLYLSWEEDLLPNTTYAFYLNGTIQDTKENNDSLMTFVFSTGDFIDSLTADYFVVDAFTNQPKKNSLVGLYTLYSDSVRPTYFAQTDASGKATLSFLKPGNYEVIAFEDKNRDLKRQVDEIIGFKNERLELIENQMDSVPIRTYAPEGKPKIRTFQFNPPGSFIVGANRDLKNATFLLNGVPLNNESFYFFAQDSLFMPFTPQDTNQYTLITKTQDWSDTTSVRVTQRERSKSIQLKFEGGSEVLPSQTLFFSASAAIESLDTSLVLLTNAKDSSRIAFKTLQFTRNRIEIDFNREKIASVRLQFLPGSVVGNTGSNLDTIGFTLVCLSQKEIGVLSVDVNDFTENLVLELLQGTDVIQRVPLSINVRKHNFNQLKAGEYSFRLIFDDNANGRWDVGNRMKGQQPENVQFFPETTKVRANWEMEAVLTRMKQESEKDLEK